MLDTLCLRLEVSALLLRSSNPFAPTEDEDDFESSFFVLCVLEMQGGGRDAEQRTEVLFLFLESMVVCKHLPLPQ